MFQKIGTGAYKGGLENVLLIDQRLDHPHKNFKIIHVAGTNGKGSVSSLMASICKEAGYKTGLFTFFIVARITLSSTCRKMK